MSTASEPTDLAAVHAELIKWLKAASNDLSNAAYYLEHPEIYSDAAKSLATAHACAYIGLDVVDTFVREQIKALRHAGQSSIEPQPADTRFSPIQ